MAKACKEGTIWQQIEEDLGQKATGLKLGARKASLL